jgi:hypothetical protein
MQSHYDCPGFVVSALEENFIPSGGGPLGKGVMIFR